MKLLIAFVLCFQIVTTNAQSLPENFEDARNKEIFDKAYNDLKDKANLPAGELMVEVALHFLDTEYVAGTLENDEREIFNVFLYKTDCIIFVEMCTAFTLTLKGLAIEQGRDPQPATPSYELLCNNIRNMRYRDGIVTDYASRIHYTSEWLIQNNENGIVSEYTHRIGVLQNQWFSFMTDHPDSYKPLKGNPEMVTKIRNMEKYLDSHAPYYLIPQNRLYNERFASEIKNGDIVCLQDTHDGLDIAHVAIAYEYNGEMHFIHASSRGKKVMIEPKTLAQYAKNGVRMARLTF